IERRIYEGWESHGWFAPRGAGAPYCIMIPPPNVTGTLHIGHAFQHTLMDALSRYHRMLGRAVLWQPGTDHAGIATQMLFVRLHEKGLIYRGKRLVNWDPVLLTALSDLEVQSQEEDGQLWHLRYPLDDGSGHVVVATTRPETMLGDAAVAVHPDDARYRHLTGKQVRLPLAGRLIPVIADAYVDPAFGSGCLKITPAHDFNDYEIGH